MAKTDDWKIGIRNDIIQAAHVYESFAEKLYLYVFGDKYFELLFKNTSFMHLTGVKPIMSAKRFYDLARKGRLTTNQIFFSPEHPYRMAKRKVKGLINLEAFTTDVVAVVEDLYTDSITYKIGVTDLKFVLGLVNSDKRPLWYVPQTMRVTDKAFERCGSAAFANMILCKQVNAKKYTQILYWDKEVPIPEHILPLIDEMCF